MQRSIEQFDAILLRLWRWLRVSAGDEQGQSMVEYAVVTALIAAAAIAALTGFGDSVKAAFDAIANKIPTT